MCARSYRTRIRCALHTPQLTSNTIYIVGATPLLFLYPLSDQEKKNSKKKRTGGTVPVKPKPCQVH